LIDKYNWFLIKEDETYLHIVILESLNAIDNTRMHSKLKVIFRSLNYHANLPGLG
jgi:hypothetical protein